MRTSELTYQDEGQTFRGYMALTEGQLGKRPVVMVVHDWSGRNEFACQKAHELAELGYLGFAVDMYGQAQVGETTEEKVALMTPLVQQRPVIVQRLRAALESVKAIPEADAHRIAIIGFCFGGLCALDLARSGMDIKGAVSFHGLLNRPEGQAIEPISAKLLVMHGYADPMVLPPQVMAFCDEMTQAKADWQLHMYGHVKHAFTNPLAHDEAMGTVFHDVAAKRSWHSMMAFLHEIFG